MSISVYTLPGLSPGITRNPDNYLAKQLFENPFTRKDIAYPNYLPQQAFLDIAKARVLAAARRPGKKILNGHSMGAQALDSLLRDEPDIDPDENVFVLTGNPERKYGGLLTVSFSGGIVVYDGVGIPDDTPFRVFDIARQYDHYADYPTINVKAARANIENQASTGVHLDYGDVRIGDPRNVGVTEGNITYLLQPTFPMPACRKLGWSAPREALEDRKIRPGIEAGYNRPFTVPAQDTKWFGGGLGFNVDTGRFLKQPLPPTWNPFT